MRDRSYAINSRALLHIAREARDRSEGSAAQAIVAITFAAIGLEAFVNEIIERVAVDQLETESSELARLRALIGACGLSSRTASLATKIEVTYAALTDHPIARGDQPYQDFELLTEVRNFVVHDRPESISFSSTGGREGPPHRVVRRLASRGVIPLPNEVEVSQGAWSSLADPRVARWAFDAALAMATFLAEAFPKRHWKERLLLGFGALTTTDEHHTVAAERGVEADETGQSSSPDLVT